MGASLLAVAKSIYYKIESEMQLLATNFWKVEN